MKFMEDAWINGNLSHKTFPRPFRLSTLKLNHIEIVWDVWDVDYAVGVWDLEGISMT